MASSSKCERPLREDEILQVFDEISSDLSDFEFSDSEIEDNEASVSVSGVSDDDESDPQEPMQHTKRRRTVASMFNWRPGNFDPEIHNFDDQNSGISVNVGDDCTVLDIFKSFFTPQIMTLIADETNRYYNFLCEKLPPTPHSRLQSWTNTTAEELYIFLGLTMLMARVKKLTIAEYWSKNPLIATPQFSAYMSRDRYLLLLRLLHFNDNMTQTQGDRLHKLKPIIDHLRDSFSSVFVPFQNLCIDESLVLFKGRLLFKQYIPSKRHRFGIKVFVLCDCETGYILDFIVYTGATTDIVDDREFGISGAVVKTLITKYLDKGHTLWLDNWYSSPLLYNWLHANGINVCGTVRRNRKEMPKMTAKLEKGQTESRHTDNMLTVRWRDRREVTMLTTLHKDRMRQSGKTDRQTNTPIMKPDCVMDYNKNMGSVDRSDMMVSFLECVRKSIKWYKKFFFHLLDVTILNSQALYNVKTGKNITLADFHLTLITEIFQEFHRPRPTNKSGRPLSGDQPLRLTERHFPIPVPPTPSKAKPTRKCHVCANTTQRPQKRKDTKFMCAKCNLSFCIHPCFEIYHTRAKF